MPEFGTVQVVLLRPDDVLVVTTDYDLDERTGRELIEKVQDAFGERKVLLVSRAVALTVMSEASA